MYSSSNALGDSHGNKHGFLAPEIAHDFVAHVSGVTPDDVSFVP